MRHPKLNIKIRVTLSLVVGEHGGGEGARMISQLPKSTTYKADGWAAKMCACDVQTVTNLAAFARFIRPVCSIIPLQVMDGWWIKSSPWRQDKSSNENFSRYEWEHVSSKENFPVQSLALLYK
jgi:hypothetical protein